MNHHSSLAGRIQPPREERAGLFTYLTSELSRERVLYLERQTKVLKSEIKGLIAQAKSYTAAGTTSALPPL